MLNPSIVANSAQIISKFRSRIHWCSTDRPVSGVDDVTPCYSSCNRQWLNDSRIDPALIQAAQKRFCE
jgi:hypothetical protein